jgi:S-adenosylmethionine:tRNA ribosyltransferase-isomerase
VKTADFNYHLPAEKIAQIPVEPRHASKLLVMQRSIQKLEHSSFWSLGNYLFPGDLLVINQTRVIPARLAVRKSTGGKAEILLLRRISTLTWEAMVGGKGLRSGKMVHVTDSITAEIIKELEGSLRYVRFDQPIEPHLERIGQTPLPPYIHTRLKDPERYQTVYAAQPGSAAAPTAGLHFTPELIDKLKDQHINFAQVTLHVGLDTFAPVMEEDVDQHKIHTEWCEVTEDTANLINRTHQSGGRIIAVGTTSVRTLETAAHHAASGQLVGAFQGATNLFILPGYKFRAIDAIITNFHLPKSTLLMLISSFTGRERILVAYQQAMQLDYRFYSFGDAMLIM